MCNKNFIQYIILLPLLISLFSCKTDEEITLPTKKENVRINMMSISEFFPKEYTSLNSVYFDRIDKDSVQILGGHFPERPYPSFAVGSDPNVLYTRINSGNRKIIFTNTKDSILYQAQHIFLRGGTYNMLIADDSVQDSTKIQYRNVFSDDSQAVQSGKIGIKFIHLSPDSGSLTVSQSLKDGSKKQLSTLDFTQSTSYMFLDQSSVISNGVIAFSFQNTKKKIFFETGIAFKPGINYLIIIKGFAYPKLKKNDRNQYYYSDKTLTTVNRIVQS